MVDQTPFLPGASEWLCRYCNERFWWHPGSKNYDRPSQCACGKVTGSSLIIPLTVIEKFRTKGQPND